MQATGPEFKFQKILDLKEQREQILKLQIAKLEKAIQEIQRASDQWLKLREKTVEELRQARLNADLQLDDQYPPYLEKLRSEIRKCSERMRELERSQANVREEVERIMRSRKLLEKFKEKQKKEYETEQEKLEQRILDSFSVQKFTNNEALL